MIKPVKGDNKQPRKPRAGQKGKLNEHVVSSLMKGVPTWTNRFSKEITTIPSPQASRSKQGLHNRVKPGKVDKKK